MMGASATTSIKVAQRGGPSPYVPPAVARTIPLRLFPDFDGNGVVNFPDFSQFVGKFGSKQGDEKYEERFDLGGDGAITFPDFLIFVSKFGKTAPLTVDMLDFPIRALHARRALGNQRDICGRVGSPGKGRPSHPIGQY